MDFDHAVDYLSGRVAFNHRRDRARLRALLEKVGDPHRRLRCLHVAGTNGKGSTTTFLDSILRAGGYKTGAYLSPYVFDIRERWMLDGAPISRELLAHTVARLKPFVDELEAREPGGITEFELKTAVAFLAFAEAQVDFAVLEVGIGGRLDATNLIDPPLVAVITSIGWDHMNLLGDTLGKIATEKAGILKPGTAACVTPVSDPEAFDAIAALASEVGVPIVRVDDSHLPDGLVLGLKGSYQTRNAATATVAATVLREACGVALSDAAIARGLLTARLPGRFQVLADGSDGRAALVLDVAHNDDGAAALVSALSDAFPGKKAIAVLGMKKGHDPKSFLRALAPALGAVVATAPPFRPHPAGEIADAARAVGLPVARVIESASEAIARTWSEAGAGDLVLVTGSFYTVGEAKALVESQFSASKKKELVRSG